MRSRIVIASIIILTVLLPISSSCTTGSTAAMGIAEGWIHEADNITSIANEITDQVIENVPGATGLLASTIKNQIKDEISWALSASKGHGDSNYSVVAASTVTLSLPILGDYGISVDYLLSVDTSLEEVTSWNIDADSFDFSKLD